MGPSWRTLAALALVATACVTLRDDLDRAEALYVDARYEDALVWFETLEPELRTAKAAERLRFHYLRGMTAYRLEQRRDARHHLALARELLDDAPAGTLTDFSRAQLLRVAEELERRGGAVAR